jgi:uncharacterized membrane protein
MSTQEEIILNKQIYIKSSPENIYKTWRDFSNLPKILDFLDTVMLLDERNSRWAAIIGEEKERLVWDIEITDDQENRLIEWHSGNNPDIFHRGQINLSNHQDKGTLLRLELHFFFPLRDDSRENLLEDGFEERIEENLRRLKLALEAGRPPGGVKEGQESLPEGLPLSESPSQEFLNTDSTKKHPPHSTFNTSAPEV